MLLVKECVFKLNAMFYFKFDYERDYGMEPQGLQMVHLGVALRSTCTYCTLSAMVLNIHGVRGTKLELHGSNLETWKL